MFSCVALRLPSSLSVIPADVGIAPPSLSPAALIEPSEKPNRAERKTFGFCVKHKTDERRAY